MRPSRIIPLVLLAAGTLFAAGRSLRWPVDIAPSITGTFAEQRGEYFHSGIDVKTEGRIGHAVRAVDDGYLHSATARSVGYGNSLMLWHGALLSQYAHLDSFVEGGIKLNSIMQVIKLLYENDVEHFVFRKLKLHFKKGDLIAYSGETGSGPPHLHFALRESGGVVNPLAFLTVPDAEAPVIRALTFCVEKFGSTVYAETVPVNDTWRGLVLEKNVFTAPEGERCFVKLSCYDRVAARSRCAVYKISLTEGTETLFAIEFPRFRWEDSSMAKYLFDASMPVFNGESLYTYILCKREGNNFSRLIEKNGGYISAGEKRRTFTVTVADFAGNATSITFSIEKDRRPSLDAGKEYQRVSASRSVILSDSSGQFAISLPRAALYRDALLKVSSAKTPESVQNLIASGTIRKEDAAEIFSVHPFDQLYRSNVRVSIKRPNWISREEADNILIYHAFGGTAPAGLLTHYNRAKDSFEAETKTNGYFFLLRDRKPPFIQLPPYQDCITDDGPFRILRFYFSDDLSGVNSKSIWLYIDGMKYPALFDYDRGWIEAKLPKKAISNGIHHIFVRAKDRANNEAFLRSLLAF